VVDLSDPRCAGKASDHRFMRRVFSPGEFRTIRGSPHPELTLWLFWAGKEAAFKSVTKARGEAPTFHHHRFLVSFSGDPCPPGEGHSQTLYSGRAQFEDTNLALLAQVSEGGLHVISWAESTEGSSPPVHSDEALQAGDVGTPDGRWKVALRERFSAPEWACIIHESSARTRLGARASLARKMVLEEERLEIRCGPGVPGRRVPLVFLDGHPLSVDLSLSHHGELLAWAFIDGRVDSAEPS
jgi:phosphopantetheinyl transferase (holo-ACP synthase)